MTEEEARDWLSARFSADAVDQVTAFAEMVKVESGLQNLVSAASLEHIWVRHIVDSAQLLAFAEGKAGPWIDVGTGAGFPGMIVGILRGDTILCEPRRRRVDFLQSAIERLGIERRVTVVGSKIESIKMHAAIISARAVASVDALLAAADSVSTKNTLWVLPKGRNAREEVAQAQRSWHGVFHVEQSITDPTSMIVVASKVSRR